MISRMHKTRKNMEFLSMKPSTPLPILTVLSIEDVDHGVDEDRFFCLGKVKGGVMTVRFTDREGIIRIIGAGYWRKGKKIYEKENHIHG
jgi:uncharacterized DUF497 family protein